MLYRNYVWSRDQKVVILLIIVILSGLEYLLGKVPTLGFVVGIYHACDGPECIWICSSSSFLKGPSQWMLKLRAERVRPGGKSRRSWNHYSQKVKESIHAYVSYDVCVQMPSCFFSFARVTETWQGGCARRIPEESSGGREFLFIQRCKKQKALCSRLPGFLLHPCRCFVASLENFSWLWESSFEISHTLGRASAPNHG